MMEHLLTIESFTSGPATRPRRTVHAVCECGWRSATYIGLISANDAAREAHDEHLAVVRSVRETLRAT